MLISKLRWKPFDIPSERDKPIDWVDGLKTVAGAGDPRTINGVGILIYACNSSMKNKCEYIYIVSEYFPINSASLDWPHSNNKI